MKYLAVIQARIGSSRLPGKVLMPLGGKTVLEYTVQRVARSRFLDEVMVATTIRQEDLPIVQRCASQGIRVFAGSETDVLDRYYQVIKLLCPEYVVRITADCPLFDSDILDQAIESLQPKTDYLGFLSEQYPDGLDLEIMKTQALMAAWKEAKLASEREHVTPYIKKHPNRFYLQDFPCRIPNISHYRLTLDEPEDYHLLQKILEKLDPAAEARYGLQEIVQLLQKEPSLAAINAKFARNEGYAKSIANDYMVAENLDAL